MLNVSILSRHSDNHTNSIYCLFSRVMLTPSIYEDGTHFLQITNVNEGYFNMPITSDSITKIKNTNLEETVWECGSVSNQGEIVIKIFKEESLEEYFVDKMNIFPKIDPKFNYFSSKAGIQIRWKKPSSGEKDYYDTSCFDNDTQIIDIDSSIKQIIILPYFAPRCVKFNFKQYGVDTNTIGSLPSFDPYKHQGHGITLPIYELPIEVNWENLHVAVEINKCIFSDEYESISHASMDPGPEIHYISTNWHLKALIAFSTKTDLMNFLDRYPKRECTFMELHFMSPYSETNQRFVFTFGDKPKNKTILEKELNIVFYEYWQ